MTSRKYFYCIVIILSAFMLANLALWHGYTKISFAQGDLNRLGSFIRTQDMLPDMKYLKHHTELREYLQQNGLKQSFDIITIGDSFSNGIGSSICYYQDYLEDRYNLRVLNLRFKNNCLLDLYILVQSGLLDEINPRAVIIESVGRSIQTRLGNKEIEFPKKSLVEAELAKISLKKQTASIIRKKISSGLLPSVIANINMKFVYYRLMRLMFGFDKLGDSYIAELDKNLFSNTGQENLLLFYHQDLNYIGRRINPAMINKNLNNASKLLQDRNRNIKLIFMGCVDKYDLYYPYVINKRGRPENILFDEIQKQPDKNYMFINTKKILRERLEQGEKDLYWAGDTHWTWKGIQIVCDELMKKLQ
ncbi:MAG: hypothetical protein IJP48_10335 [Synergistaceae bacterium]|nr:hypothetical protein [Synergistaceae bacterium]